MKKATQKDSPALWPLPFLPVRRIGGDAIWNDADLGIVTHRNGEIIPTVFICNMLDVNSEDDLNQFPREEYDSVADLFVQWEVD